jgi:hypothetical protein
MINQWSVFRHSKVPILLTPLFLCRNLKCLFFSCDKYWDIERVTEPKVLHWCLLWFFCACIFCVCEKYVSVFLSLLWDVLILEIALVILNFYHINFFFSMWANMYRELAYRVNETLGFMTCAGLTSEIWPSNHECLFIPYKQCEFCSYYLKIA